MEPSNFWRDVWVGLIPNGIAALAGFLLAYFIRDRLLNPYRFGGSRLLVKGGGEVKTDRAIGWRKAQEIAEDISEQSIFLKGVVSPYGWINCDIVQKGKEVGLLTIDKKKKFLFGEARTYTIDLDKNPPPERPPAPPPAARPQPATPPLLLNFAHPLTAEHLAAIAALTGQAVGEVREEPTQTAIDPARPLREQAAAIVDGFGLPADDWQTRPILINPPGYAPATAALLAELHGRMGHFPAILRLRPVAGSTPTRYEVAEIVDLNVMRGAAREKRRA